MSGQQQVRKTTTEKVAEVEETVPADTEKADALKAELDELLDEIDTVLESEDFVKAYQQKGGQ